MLKKLFNIILYFLSLFSLRFNHALGAILGRLIYLLPTQIKHVAKINIALCFPQTTSQAQKQLLKTSLIESAKTFTEIGPIWRWPITQVIGLVQEVINGDAVQKAFQQGKGIIFVTPHLACWELAGLYTSSKYPLTTLYRPPRQTAFEELINSGRERGGNRMVIPNIKGIRSLYQALAKGETIGILPDQEPAQGSGIFVPFFGHDAYTMILLSRLAHKSQAAVFFAYCERLPLGQGYKLVFNAAPSSINDKDIEISVRTVNQCIEDCVLSLPEQYQWGYKRFRTQANNKTIY